MSCFFSPLLLHCPLEMLTKIGCMSSPCVSLSYTSNLKCFYCHYQERFNICRCIFYTLLCFQQANHFFCHAVRFLKATRWYFPTSLCAGDPTHHVCNRGNAVGNAVTGVSAGSCWTLDCAQGREKGFPNHSFMVAEDQWHILQNVVVNEYAA